MKIDEVIEKIKKDSRFLKLKNVVENNVYHDQQPVYDHTMLVFETAKEKIKGDFIENPKARKLFLEFTNEKIDKDLSRGNCMVLAALLHDIGKAGAYKDGDVEKTILKTDSQGNTSCPGHEYVSSIFIPELIKGLVSDEAVSYISKIASLHDSINDQYFQQMKDWNFKAVLESIKFRSYGLYIESLFNIYCDIYYAEPSAYLREMALKIFNSSNFYIRRVYSLK